MRGTPTGHVVPHSDLLIQNWGPNQAYVRYNALLVPCDRVLNNVTVLFLRSVSLVNFGRDY